MLPVTHGIDFCKTCVLLYSVLLGVVCVIPYLIGMSGWLYLVISVILNGVFIYKAIQLKWYANQGTAMNLFKYSIVQLMLLFIGLFLDKWFL